MALVFRGLSRCSVCNEVIQANDEVIAFPHVISNESDLLWRFSDSACHADCAQHSPKIQKLMAITEERHRRTGPGKRKCQVCGEEILDWDDCIMFGYLGDPAIDALARFNFTHLHKSHVAKWQPVTEFLTMAQAEIDDGHWAGRFLELLMRDLQAGTH